MLLLLLDTDVQVPKRSPRARSIILTAKAAMAGGKQLFEGAHLTDGNTRFCRKSSKCRNYALFVGQISVKFSGLKMCECKKMTKFGYVPKNRGNCSFLQKCPVLFAD